MAKAVHFTKATYTFLRELELNNQRDWFAANKQRYERDVKEAALSFIRDFGQDLVKISPYFRADPRPNGGSLFRIYRDIRFSKDKRPYKTHVGIHFRHVAGKDAHAPGFYLHLQPGNSFVGVGLWHPNNPTLKKIRDALVKEPQMWRQVVGKRSFQQRYQIQGDKLKRTPPGYDPDHPLGEVLKLRDITAFAGLTQKDVTAVGFIDEFAADCRAGAPLARFICQALELPF